VVDVQIVEHEAERCLARQRLPNRQNPTGPAIRSAENFAEGGLEMIIALFLEPKEHCVCQRPPGDTQIRPVVARRVGHIRPVGLGNAGALLEQKAGRKAGIWP
jgi:hypothetical protein